MKTVSSQQPNVNFLADSQEENKDEHVRLAFTYLIFVFYLHSNSVFDVLLDDSDAGWSAASMQYVQQSFNEKHHPLIKRSEQVFYLFFFCSLHSPPEPVRQNDGKEHITWLIL